jgi:polyhydroxyalkanoate synthase
MSLDEGEMSSEEAGQRMAQYWALVQRANLLLARASTKAVTQVADGDYQVNDVETIGSAFLNAWTEFAANPVDFLTFQRSAMEDMSAGWIAAWTGEDEDVKDRRFRDPLWSQDPFSRGLRNVHLALESSVNELLASMPKGSKEQLTFEFYTRQFLSAISPSNFLALNPVAKARLFETEGQSLLDGFENYLDDLERGDGRLDISTNDPDAFTVGENLATTPGKVVFQNDLMQLIQFDPLTDTQRKRPMLLVPAWINKYYILDMRPENSLVRYLLNRGHSVFVVSWVNPGAEHAEKSFEDYMMDGPLAAIDAIEQATGEKKVNILGFCIGGILVTATLAYLAARGEDRIATATTLASMVDFTDVGEIGVFVDKRRVEDLRNHMKDKGYLESHFLKDTFSMLRENDLIWSFHVMNYLMGKKPPAFDLLFWNADSTRLPAEMLLWYLQNIYIENGLRKPGHLSLNGTDIDIGKIKVPCFVLATKDDHIAPWKSVYPTAQLLGGKPTFVLGGSGHIAGVINPPANRIKYGYWTGDDYSNSPDDWLAKADYTEGSWWPYWAEWLEKQDRAKEVPARVPGDAKLGVIEPAPGSFVSQR